LAVDDVVVVGSQAQPHGSHQIGIVIDDQYFLLFAFVFSPLVVG